MTSKLYYECHVTVEPVFDVRLQSFEKVAAQHGFKVANLLMQKREEDTAERSKYDTFATTRGRDYGEVEGRMFKLLTALKLCGFKVWRYKIEDTLLDVRVEKGTSGEDPGAGEDVGGVQAHADPGHRRQ